MLHKNPERLHRLECLWNWKTNFCSENCESAEKLGIGAVHGISGAFFDKGNETQYPVFKALFETFKTHKFDQNCANLAKKFNDKIKKVKEDSPCIKKAYLISYQLENNC